MLEKLKAALDIVASCSWMLGFAPPLLAARRPRHDIVVWKPKVVAEVETRVAELIELVQAARAETKEARNWAAHWRRLAEDQLQRDQWHAQQHMLQQQMQAMAQYNQQSQMHAQNAMAQAWPYQQALGLGPFHSCTPSRHDALTGRFLDGP